MVNDISLAVGDGARRMTYAELAAIRGTSQHSVERLVRRRRWSRQVEDDGVVRVLVPLTEVKNVKEPKADSVVLAGGRVARAGPPIPPASHPIAGADIVPIIRDALRELIEPLAAQLEQEGRRAEDAIASERISAALAANLRTELERRQEWRFWRRLGWALSRR